MHKEPHSTQVQKAFLYYITAITVASTGQVNPNANITYKVMMEAIYVTVMPPSVIVKAITALD